MSNVTTRIVTQPQLFEVAAPNPTWRSKIYKALAITEAEHERVNGCKAERDDAFKVVATDEEIILQFEIKEGH
jgi:hypothetical protein